ncbi:MAG: hypothetical protein ACAI44_28650 [Candidatus Sericytochromatia bacterium]
METHRVSPEVYSALKKFSKNDVISKQEHEALGMIMSQDGLDADEQKVLDALENKVAFSISDGSRSRSVDPLKISFPVTTEAQARQDKRDPVRAEIYAQLERGGVKEKDIAATMRFLDRVGIKTEDMAELVKNQLARYGAKDALAGLQAYGLAHEALSIEGLPEPNKYQLPRLAAQIKAGNYRMDAETEVKMPPEVGAQAETDTDTIRLREVDLENPFHRAIILHEMVHASHDLEFGLNHDLEVPPVSIGFTEQEAYLAQGLYLLHAHSQDEYHDSQRSSQSVSLKDYASAHIAFRKAQDAAGEDPDNPALREQVRSAEKVLRSKEDALYDWLVAVGYPVNGGFGTNGITKK